MTEQEERDLIKDLIQRFRLQSGSFKWAITIYKSEEPWLFNYWSSIFPTRSGQTLLTIPVSLCRYLIILFPTVIS